MGMGGQRLKESNFNSQQLSDKERITASAGDEQQEQRDKKKKQIAVLHKRIIKRGVPACIYAAATQSPRS